MHDCKASFCLSGVTVLTFLLCWLGYLVSMLTTVLAFAGIILLIFNVMFKRLSYEDILFVALWDGVFYSVTL